MLPRAEFIQLLQTSPLVSIDIVAQDMDGRVLTGWRTNAPARDTWFVPGGRLRKDETFAAALARISAYELGVELTQADVSFMGVYQHIYPDNAPGVAGLSTHYVVIACSVTLEPRGLCLDPGQHSETRWFTVDELLAHPDVHDNTKAYFVERPDNRFG